MMQWPISTRTNLFRVGVHAIVRMCSTRTNYWLSMMLEITLGCTLLALGVQHSSVLTIALFVPVGLFLFSFIEYLFHRWIFHTRISPFAEGHSKHHCDPQGYDALPFFLPTLILLGLFGLFLLCLPGGSALLLTGVITFGYVTYGLSHFIIHHVCFKQPLLRRWAAFHHIHHHHPGTNFGVTSPLWDYLLGTRYVRTGRSR